MGLSDRWSEERKGVSRFAWWSEERKGASRFARFQQRKSGRFFWVKRGESARCRNGDLVICKNARVPGEVTGAPKKSPGL
jgi:hypothetical protein